LKYPILETIYSPDDVKALHKKQLPQLAQELRDFIIETVSETGGHVASSLGAVEIILAMHRVFDAPQDKLLFDVGHQAYAHKILTGRRERFHTLRQAGGVSGFPKRGESIFDAFDTGHASTAVSAALGMARGLKLQDLDSAVVALTGDGALTGGLNFEAFNDIDDEELPLVVILNDNEMSISPNVGSLNRRLVGIRTSRIYVRFKRALVRFLETGRFGRFLSRRMLGFKNGIKRILMPNNLFEEFGFIYIGPVDGHNVRKLEKVLRRARLIGRPVLVHALTQKGKGYTHSEGDPQKFHGIAPFSVMTGKVTGEPQASCSAVFGQTMVALAKENPKLVAITAAMEAGTGLSEFALLYPNRFFDVGIAEEHAVTMAAGMAAVGLTPVVAVYSSFLQRAYDQLLHDVALQNLHVVIALDRAGLVGEDGETHQGVYDPGFLATMPNLAVYAPASVRELREMLTMAIARREPAVVRYNRGTLPDSKLLTPITFGKWEVLQPLGEINIIAAGTMVPLAHWVAKKNGYGCVNARFLQPLDTDVLDDLKQRDAKILVVEENIVSLGLQIASYCNPCLVKTLGLPVCSVTQATVSRQREWFGLTERGLEQMLESLKP